MQYFNIYTLRADYIRQLAFLFLFLCVWSLLAFPLLFSYYIFILNFYLCGTISNRLGFPSKTLWCSNLILYSSCHEIQVAFLLNSWQPYVSIQERPRSYMKGFPEWDKGIFMLSKKLRNDLGMKNTREHNNIVYSPLSSIATITNLKSIFIFLMLSSSIEDTRFPSPSISFCQRLSHTALCSAFLRHCKEDTQILAKLLRFISPGSANNQQMCTVVLNNWGETIAVSLHLEPINVPCGHQPSWALLCWRTMIF